VFGTHRIAAVMLSLLLTMGILSVPVAAGASSSPPDCRHPRAPKGFHKRVVTAIRVSGNLPREWADSPYLAKIICWQDTGFSTSFRNVGPDHVWHGVFAMTVQELKEIAGPWLSNDRNELILDQVCFVRGWDACRHTTANARIIQQLIAGLRWIWLNYGRPIVAWRHIVKTGRFTSYPRPGTDTTVTHDPLTRCPVDGSVGFQDDFGEYRNVGGYHPHSGNDIGAPVGRAIRAPFSGLAVAHSDDWFAGRYLILVGREGIAHNAHLSRFGYLGYVTAGTVIGYVGATGDARNAHDHFEWHPWNVPDHLHLAPSGLSRIRDAIDPYPFLNQVCA
jgi:Peptidase family M23